MKISHFAFSIFSCLSQFCYAKRDLIERNSAFACSFYFAKINQWDYHPTSSNFYSTICSFLPASQSWTVCIFETIKYNSHANSSNQINGTFAKSLEYVNNICKSNWNETFYFDLLNNGSHFMKTKPKGDENDPQLINFPIKTDLVIRERINHAYHLHSRNIDLSNTYGSFLYIYCLLTLFFGVSVNYFDQIGFNVVLFKSKLFRWMRAYIIIPTFFGHHANYLEIWDIFIGLIPTRLESLIIIGYLIQHIYLLFANYQYDEFNVLISSKRLQSIRFFADRAGILSFAHFPLIILFCTRNSIIEYLTDLKFSSSISFHKWFGRIMCLDAVLHGSAYMCYAMLTTSFNFSRHQTYYQFGIIACFLVIIMVFFSFGYFRKYYYETFLYGHIILAILFFYSCWKHVESLGWKQWIYSSIFIWITERALRIIRVMNCGLLSSKITLIDDSLLKVTIMKPKDRSLSLLSSTPGQYYFIYFMHPLIFWQSHPFTIVNNIDTITMIIKPKDGATKFIKNLVLKGGSTSLDMKVGLEGPYGKTPSIHFCENILFLTGGTGLPGPISHILDFISRENFKSHVYLSVVIRDVYILEAYKDLLLELNHPQVEISLYFTGKLQDSTYSDSVESTEITPLNRDSSRSNAEVLKIFETFCRIHRHRPDIKNLINVAAKDSKSLAIVTCGAPKFVDVSRNSTSQAILDHSDKSILYYEEFQCW